jgi:murein lipoprotein
MKKSLLMISMMLVLAIAVGGCATKGDLARVETQEKLIGAKADQAAQDAQAAKAAADAATLKANEAAARAEDAVKRAEERERIADEKARIADEKAKQADAVFQKSMKK